MVETSNSAGQDVRHRDSETMKVVADSDQKARFCAEIAALVPAVMSGDLTGRMGADYTDADLRRSAAILNELIASIDDNLSDFNAAMAALADGDLEAGLRDKHRGTFGQLQKNFNLALVTIRRVLGEQGSDQFADRATKFSRMLAGSVSTEGAFEIRAADRDSRPISSPPHDLWLKLAESLARFSV